MLRFDGITNCTPDGQDVPIEIVTFERWWKMPAWEPVPVDSNRISGSFREVIGNETSEWEWTLEKVKQ